MKKIKLALTIIIVATSLFSCSNSQSSTENDDELHLINKVMQQPDGSIALHVNKAEWYKDVKDPSTNTAEWNVVMSKPGRFDVWLSSATTDTIDLGYKNKATLKIHDNILEIQPVVNKVMKDASEVKSPYFRVDSFMGSMYIQDTGLYLVQIISDKILPEEAKEIDEKTKLLSVILPPTTR